jgi:hypothetical protein
VHTCFAAQALSGVPLTWLLIRGLPPSHVADFFWAYLAVVVVFGLTISWCALVCGLAIFWCGIVFCLTISWCAISGVIMTGVHR